MESMGPTETQARRSLYPLGRRHDLLVANVPVLTAALYQRFASRGESEFADRVLSAMRHVFGGHEERGR